MFKKFIDALKPPQEPDVKEPEKETAVPQITYTKPISYETTMQLQELDRIQKAKMNALWAQMAEVIQPVELRELILDLGISPADVPGTKNETVCLEFVYYMLRRRRIPELLEALPSRWPAVDWPPADILLAINNYTQFQKIHKSSPPSKWDTQDSPQQENWSYILHQGFNLSELATLAFDLGIDFENLPGNGKSAKITSLLSYVEKQQQGDQLAGYISQHRHHYTVIPSKTTDKTIDYYRQMLTTLNLAELKIVSRQVDLNLEDVSGSTYVDKVDGLIGALNRRGRLPDLDLALQELLVNKKEEETYKTERIRALIFQVFPDDEAMTAFCRQHLPEAVYEFGSGMSYRQKVQALLEFCTFKNQFGPLLAALETAFPEEFTAVGPVTQENAA